MTNTKKTEGRKTQASATELDESELNDVEGGALFLKLGDIDGESLKIDRGGIGALKGTNNVNTQTLKLDSEVKWRK